MEGTVTHNMDNWPPEEQAKAIRWAESIMDITAEEREEHNRAVTSQQDLKGAAELDEAIAGTHTG